MFKFKYRTRGVIRNSKYPQEFKDEGVRQVIEKSLPYQWYAQPNPSGEGYPSSPILTI